MAGSCVAATAVKWALDKLSSLLTPVRLTPVASSSSSVNQGLEDLQTLERIMDRIHATLLDAEQHWNIHEESTKLRLRELKELAYGAQDLVEEYEYEVNLRKLLEARPNRSENTEGSSNNSKRKRHQKVNDEHFAEAVFVPPPNKLAGRARKLIQRYEEMIAYHKHFGLSDNDGERRIVPDVNSIRHTSSFVFEESIVGRESDKDAVIEKLMSGQGSNVARHLSVLAIVGMGGLGKTTLAQLVYNEPMVKETFTRAWVYVSDHFDPKILMKKIVASIKNSKEKSNESEQSDPQEKLIEEIKGKKILLVLDDVWNERGDCWEALRDPLLTAQQCKILVTTRNVAVARLVQTMPHYALDYLSPHESWALFERTVTVQKNVIEGNLVDIAEKIVEKCDGLPLAIKALGSSLRYVTDEKMWKEVLESGLWDLDKARIEVLPALELSYKNTPMHLKRYFVALCLFPKNYPIEKSKVIWLWKCLDMLQDDESNDDETGSQYFDELVQRSFLQLSFISFVMHDLIHDLASQLSGNEFFRLEGEKPVQIPTNTRFMSILECDTSVQFSVSSHPLWAIIVLEWEGYCKVRNLEQIFLHCKNLRVLSIGNSNLGEALPSYMSDLKLLRHLELTTDSDDERDNAPSGIGLLINLHTLPMIHCCSFNLRELMNMNKIRELRISGLGNLSHIEDAKEVQLVSKRHLQSLELGFSCRDFNCEKEQCENMLQHDDFTEDIAVRHKEILESLRPHKYLRKLKIEGYGYHSYPSWLGDASFSMLTEIVISGRGWDSQPRVPTLGDLPFLKSLEITIMASVEHIGREFCSLVPGYKAFPSLTSLKFVCMPWWTEWSGVDYGDFPCLQTLLLANILRLSSLPLDRFTSLDTLNLNGCNGINTIPAGGTIKKLWIYGCDVLHTLCTQPSLLKLELRYCPKLSKVGSMPKLVTLDILECPNLHTVGFLYKLTTLTICSSLADGMLFSLLDYLPLLEYLYISSGTVTHIPLDPQRLPSLARLQLLSCTNLQYCDGLVGFTSLRSVTIWHCPLLLVPSELQNLHTIHYD